MKREVISLCLALCMASVQASFDTLHTECVEKESLTVEEVHHFSTHMDDAEVNPKLKCFTACAFEHSGIMENCKVKDDIFSNLEVPQEVQAMYATCKSKVTADERCECGYQLARCLEDLAEIH